jgi:hypothetical protein
MTRFFVRSASEADNSVLCELAGMPIEGQIALALERRPDFFVGSKVQNEAIEINVVCDRSQGDRIAAVFSSGRRREFVDRKVSWVRYLSDVRISPAYRGGRIVPIMNSRIIERETASPSATIQTVMFSDNDAMRRVIRRRPRRALWWHLKHLWFYDLGAYRTSAVSLMTGARRHEYRYTLRRATSDDVEAMQAFFDSQAPAKQLYPRYRFDRLDEPYYANLSIDDYFLAYDGTELVGITGIWDQQAFKQTRVVGYAGALRWSRPIANVIGRLTTGFSLPRTGSELRYLYLHTIVTRDNSVAVFGDLVEHIFSTYRDSNHEYFLCGLFTHDPLISVLDSFRSRRDVMAQHYEIGIDELEHALSPESPLYVEAARI